MHHVVLHRTQALRSRVVVCGPRQQRKHLRSMVRYAIIVRVLISDPNSMEDEATRVVGVFGPPLAHSPSGNWACLVQ